MPKIVILGAGVGGVIVANRLARRLRRREAEILVADTASRHTYQPGLLYLSFDNTNPDALTRPIRRLLHPQVELVQGAATAIDPAARSVRVNGDTIAYDWLVIATGSRLVPDRVPGFSTAHQFYDLEGAVRLRSALRAFPGGRIVVGPSRKIFKCPPAPLEFVLLLDDYLRRRSLRHLTDLCYLTPFAEVFQGKKVARVIAPLLDARGIRVVTDFAVKEIRGQTVCSHAGREVAFDLAILVPPHRVAPAIEAAGLAPEGWVPVDPRTLQVRGQDRIFALGDVTDLSIPKTGAVAHFQAPTVVDRVLTELRGAGRQRAYNGRVLCLIETGTGRATMMGFDYDRPGQPSEPSRLYHWAKAFINRTYWMTIPSGRI